LIVLDSLFPVFALIVLGGLLKRFHLTADAFLKTSDRLIYYIFFPALLFWKIGAAPTGGSVDWGLCKAAVCAILVTYALSTAYALASRMPAFKVGSFSQSCYRFNTYIGMAIMITAIGETGAMHFGILVGVAIPVINVLAVSTLIWFSGKSISSRDRVRMTLKALASNPLIIACLAGILYSRAVGAFPVFIDNTLKLAAMVSLPMALLSIGGVLTFKNLRGNFGISLKAAVFKLLIYPALGWHFLEAFAVSPLQFKVGMIFFTLPASTSIYVLSSQLHSDTELASASIVLSTALSFAPLSAALLL
jgi:predicted permease